MSALVTFPDGIAICGEFPLPNVLQHIDKYLNGKKLPLTIADPPYGNISSEKWDWIAMSDRSFCSWMIDWTNVIAERSMNNSALYVWGGVGKPLFRPFYRYMVEVEMQTKYRLANHITWAKKRAYGVAHNFLFCREELAYLLLGDDIKKPLRFNIPLLDKERGYAGYSKKYPAKSKFLRRTNVWNITEILRGKVHDAQKPAECMQIPIDVHTVSGDVVLDPFGGSGTTALVARELNRRFVIVEKDPDIFEQMVSYLR